MADHAALWQRLISGEVRLEFIRAMRPTRGTSTNLICPIVIEPATAYDLEKVEIMKRIDNVESCINDASISKTNDRNDGPGFELK
jgi:hypothetical protein